MSRKPLTPGRAAVGAVLLLLTAALGLGGAGTAAAQDKVTLAYVPILKFATAYVAQSRGIFVVSKPIPLISSSTAASVDLSCSP